MVKRLKFSQNKYFRIPFLSPENPISIQSNTSEILSGVS